MQQCYSLDEEGRYGPDIKNRFTACNVARDGLISGLEDVSHASRCRIKILSITGFGSISSLRTGPI